MLDAVKRLNKAPFHQQTDLESTDPDSPKPDASMRQVQESSEPRSPIDKGIKLDVGGFAKLEPEGTSSISSSLATMAPKQSVLSECPGTEFSTEPFP